MKTSCLGHYCMPVRLGVGALMTVNLMILFWASCAHVGDFVEDCPSGILNVIFFLSEF